MHWPDLSVDAVPGACSKELSPRASLAIVRKLGLSEDFSRRFLQSVVEARAHREASRVGKALAAPDLRPTPIELDSETYEKVAKVDYLALLELVFTEDFRWEAGWISSRLGLKREDGAEMIDQLVKAGLLRREGRELMNPNVHATAIKNDETDRTRRRLQEEILERAKKSLQNDAFDLRAHYGMTMAINLSKLELARERIRAFMESLSDELETSPQSEVYQLAVQLFPLSRPLLPGAESASLAEQQK